MNKDEEFILQWKPNHNKGLVVYILRFAVIYTAILALSVVVLYFAFPLRRNNLISVLQLYIINIVIITTVKILDWFNKEKRYRKSLVR